MATVRVVGGVGDLAADLSDIPVKAIAEGSKVVRKNVRAGSTSARAFARELSGPHGKDYYKRIGWEMTGALQGEYGPHDGGLPVGGGWRHGTPNTELEKSQDVIGPKFEKDVGDMVDRLFW
jgi:hypothetical protein